MIKSVMDLFATLTIIFLVLFVLSTRLINPEATEENPKEYSIYRVTVLWDEIDSDVDTWAVRLKDGEPISICGYPGQKREAPPFVLQNDHTSATYGMVDGKELDVARETLDVRSDPDGVYRFSLHWFSKDRDLREDRDKIVCRVQVEQIAPYKILYSSKVEICEENEKAPKEFPFFEFELKDGKLVNPKKSKVKPFLGTELQ